jgi:8-oxo-dGTP pyrophosphatase MutT (NUDIX family)
MYFIETIRNEFQKPLPGEEKQWEMAAGNRVFFKEYKPVDEPKTGCVLILLYLKNEKWHTLFIKRTSDNGPHSGQMAFPGGSSEPFDGTLFNTALRETYEEIGINPSHVEFIGRLTPLLIPVSNFWVHAFVGYLSYEPGFILNHYEVEDVAEVPVDYFFSSGAISSFTFIHREKEYEAPCFLLDQYKIWGATAMLWNEFLAMYQNALKNE